MNPTQTKRPTTKEELKMLIALWPDHSLNQIAEKTGRNVSWVNTMTKKLRVAGVSLPKKPSIAKAYLIDMIAEVAKEAR